MIKLILAILGALILFKITGGFLGVFLPADDTSIGTLDMMVGEIKEGVKYVNLNPKKDYRIVIPLSLPKTYQITAFYGEGKSYTRLMLTGDEFKEIRNVRLDYVKVTFDSNIQ